MTWDPGLHPRHPAGAPGGRGGEFAPRAGQSLGKDAVDRINEHLESVFGIGGPRLLGFEPLDRVLYHGSQFGFSHIIDSMFSSNAHAASFGEPLMFLTDSKALAGTYGSVVSKFRVSLRRAMVIDMRGRDWQEAVSVMAEMAGVRGIGNYGAFVYKNVQDFGAAGGYSGGPMTHTVVAVRSPSETVRRLFDAEPRARKP